MPDSQGQSVRLKGILEGAASWVRILDDGRVELEYFDYSSAAQDHFGNDVAWMYRIDTGQKPVLFELLTIQTGIPITDDQSMLDAFERGFRSTWTIRDWLKEKGVPFEEEFDSWA